MLSWALLIPAGVYLGLAGYLYAFQEQYVYFPTSTVTTTPEAARLPYEDIWLVTGDGIKLHAWFVPAPAARFTVLFLHGNGGNISHRLDTLRIFHDLGLDCLIVDYRGYGRSAGRPSEQGTYEDARTGWRYLVRDRGVPAENIVFFGRSLGGAVATRLALEHPPRALIIESAFTSIADLGAHYYPWLPTRLLARIRYDNLGGIGRVQAPVLVVHSPEDEIVPFVHGRRLFEAAPEPKQFLEIRGGHNNGFLVSRSHYQRGLEAFLSGPAALAPPGMDRRAKRVSD